MSEDEPGNPTALYAWGNDTFGQLGLGKKAERTYSFPVLCTLDIAIAQVACGEEHSALRTEDGLVYTMGSNADGRLGINDRSLKLASTPAFVNDLAEVKVASIACGAAHTAALTASGEVFTWGLGSSGALGTGNSLSHWRPHAVVFAEEMNAQQVTCGGRHTAVVSVASSGAKKLYLFGAGDSGQLGTGHRDSNLLPRLLPFSESIEEAACGSLHTLFRTSTSRVFAMGANSFGQLGIGSKRSVLEPQQVVGLDGLRIKQLACWSFSTAVTMDGGLYVWGTGSFGEFLVPQRVKTASEIEQIAVGSGFAVVMDRSGLLWSWGSNSGGELGLGDFESRTSPAPLTTLQGKAIRQIACGAGHAIALGENQSSQRSPSPYLRRDPSVASVRSSVSDLETQSHSRLFRLYQSELDARKMLELELFKEQQTKLAYIKQVESLTIENQDLRDAVRRSETALAQTQADISWHSQSSQQLSVKNKSLSEKIKEIPVFQQRVEDLQVALSACEKAKRRLEEALEAANSRIEDLEFSNSKSAKELVDARSDLRRTETELQETSRMLGDARRKGEKATVEADIAVQELTRKLQEVEKDLTTRIHEHSMKVKSQEEVIKDLRNRLQAASSSASSAQADAARLEAKVATLARELADRDAKIQGLEDQMERQEVKNKSLVEALEREVKERASSLRRAKDVLATPDLSRISPLSPSLDPPTSFRQNKQSLEARLSAFERKMNLR